MSNATKHPATQLFVGWLFCCFCLGLFLRFSHKPDPGSTPDIIQVAERLSVVGRYSPNLDPGVSKKLLEMAEEIEEDPQAKMVIRGEAPKNTSGLTPVYSLMAEELDGSITGKKKLSELAREGLTRFAISGGLLTLLMLMAAVSLLTPKREETEPDAPTTLGPIGVLGVFFGWDVLGFIGLGTVLASLHGYVDSFTLVIVSQILLYLLLVLVLSRAKLCKDARPFRKFSLSWIGKGYFSALAIVLVVNFITTALSGEAPKSENPVLSLFAEAPHWKVAMLGLLVVFVGPFFEEIVFRGWLFGGLRRSWGDTPALLLSSLLFALIHGDAPGLIPLFCLGMIFGWVYRRSGSLWASIIVHGFWNATTFSLLISVMP